MGRFTLPMLLELGPLKNMDFELSEDVLQRLTELTPKCCHYTASAGSSLQKNHHAFCAW